MYPAATTEAEATQAHVLYDCLVPCQPNPVEPSHWGTPAGEKASTNI